MLVDRRALLELKARLALRDPKETKELPDHRDQLDLKGKLVLKDHRETLGLSALRA